MRITFLGTAAARPTVGRNVSSLLLAREGEHFLFDCGEGTQRQMMRFGTGFTLNDIFFTHLHADHFLGVIGLLRTMGLQERTEPMQLWAPRGGGALLEQAVHLGVERVPFPVQIHELQPDERVERDGFAIVAYAAQHGPNALGYAVIEEPRLGRFDVSRARALGVPDGPLFGRLHHGEDIEVAGRIVRAADVVGEPRPGRKVVYSGDTRPSRATIQIAQEADLLIHDATFAQEEAVRARITGHATAREAAEVAVKAGVRRLILTHLSARYADDPRPLEREAREVFPQAQIAQDGMVVEVPFADADAEP